MKLHEVIIEMYNVEALMNPTERRTLKMVLAAYLYLHKTRDGMEICEIIDVQPETLDKWNRSAEWEKALQVWDSTAEARRIEGKKYALKVKPGRKDYRRYKPALYSEQQGVCAGCLDHLSIRHLTVDHIVPVSQGGTHGVDNLQLLCHSCNQLKDDKSNKYLIDTLIVQGVRQGD